MPVLDTAQSAIRRSTRLHLEIPVRVAGTSNGASFSEPCYTTVVNAHGCGVVSPRAAAKGTKVRLEIDSAKRHTTAQVVAIVSLGGEPECWLLGLELEIPGNFWGIEYAPADWKVEEDPSQENISAGPPPKQGATTQRWKLTDISDGACYLESATPFALGTAVVVSIRATQKECVAEGIVRASHPQTGMAVEFARAPGLRERVEEIIGHLGSQREGPRIFVGRKEKAAASHTQEPAQVAAEPADAEDHLLALVRLAPSLTSAQFLENLRAQRLGRRRDPRIDIALPVSLIGKDVVGRPLDQRVTTVNISKRGALLQGIHGVPAKETLITLARGAKKEDFFVVWVADDEAGTKIGVAAVDQDSKFWADVLETAAAQSHR